MTSSSVCGRPSSTRSSGARSAAVIGSESPTVWRAKTSAGGVAGRKLAGFAPRSSGATAPGSTPASPPRNALESVAPCARHSAWSSARSTKLVPKPVSSGGRRRAAPHADCAASSSRQKPNAVGARSSLACCSAVRITSNISSISSARPRAGSLVNHFGGSRSAASPRCRAPPSSNSASRMTCGTSVIVAMP